MGNGLGNPLQFKATTWAIVGDEEVTVNGRALLRLLKCPQVPGHNEMGGMDVRDTHNSYPEQRIQEGDVLGIQRGGNLTSPLLGINQARV